jgi:hypothetical protein
MAQVFNVRRDRPEEFSCNFHNGRKVDLAAAQFIQSTGDFCNAVGSTSATGKVPYPCEDDLPMANRANSRISTRALSRNPGGSQ